MINIPFPFFLFSPAVLIVRAGHMEVNAHHLGIHGRVFNIPLTGGFGGIHNRIEAVTDHIFAGGRKGIRVVIVFIIIMVITEISKTLGEKRRTVIDLEEETGELQEKPETVKRERHFSKPHPILYIKERLSQMSANKPQRRRKPVRYDYESFYYDDYDDYEYEYEIIRVKRRPRKRSHQKSRKKSFVLGLAMGLGIAGVIIIIYRFIKKRKERGTEDNEQ